MRLNAVRVKPLRDWTLRARLVASMLGLLAVLCIAIGAVTEVALQHFLMGRLDDQLNQAGGRFSHSVENPPPRTSGGPSNGSDFLPRGQAPGTIGAHLSATGTSSGQIRGQSADSDLSNGSLAALLAVNADGEPHTVSLPGIGSYRVIASAMPDGDVLVTGLPLAGVTDTISKLTLVITGVSASGLVVAGFAGTVIVRLALRPLRRVTTTASKVAEMPLDEGEVALAVRVDNPNPHTEVGQVGVALNRMLENVSDALNARHRSETRVRQFVADASHELRTPLASIRGYAELTRRSREVAPPDIAHAMSRVESEAGRMTTLVEDLLLLARLDAGRPLEAAEVDLSRLVVDVLSDAHAAGPDHHWHLDLPDDPVLIIGDQARLHQVVANLLSNARNHTPAGTNIRVSLSAHGTVASIEVADDGPGIAPDLVGDIFERFSRGEQSRSRGAGSTGLGLAIVNAVLNAHRGSIAVQSRPGRTVFTVSLPMHGNRQVDPQDSSSMVAQPLQV
jgi:two-component system, OmpR family, sensor kinase